MRKAFVALAALLDRAVGWHRLPRLLGIATLIGLQRRLRERNLYDSGLLRPSDGDPDAPGYPDRAFARTLDGRYNDLTFPLMGSKRTPFGRNVPRMHGFPEGEPRVLQPSPREVSRRLLTREQFLPATTLNVLAAAWIQFEIHDWFRHAVKEQDSWKLELDGDDPWEGPRPMPIRRVKPHGRGDKGSGPFLNTETHWWDGSQLYGSDRALSSSLREDDGKLKVGADGLLPEALENKKLDPSDPARNMWLGLALLHTLFAREHNAICDRLRAMHPTWTGDRVYDKARLINAALMAKIHTVEWTPAIIAHPTTQLGMHANWWGVIDALRGAGTRPTPAPPLDPWKPLKRFRSSEVLGGIPGSPTDHHGVPYSLTEEFAYVYRMHPLLPDEFTFHSVEDHRVLGRHELPDVSALKTRESVREIGPPNALYSLGIAHPGEITLHNFPRHLQDLVRPGGERLDLATIDILRSRECGVPRYNDFRRCLGLRPARSFQDIASRADWAEEIREVYRDDVEDVDVMVGLYGEKKPRGFGFSDTAFRVFLLMAPRRLKSDRFFTRDYTRDVYTPAGMEWIDNTTMVDILARHYPSLRPVLTGVDNAFKPWPTVR